jgi:hypothetical protein
VRLYSVAEEVVKKRYKEDPTGTQMDMMGSFMRHGVKEFDAVAESLLQMYTNPLLTLTLSPIANISTVLPAQTLLGQLLARLCSSS